jgi:starvation-inducible DNA-binding protein
MDYLGLDPARVNQTVEKLNKLLSDYHIYYQNLRNFHWNVKGENFFELHEQFEGLYTHARTTIDDIAERILTLRHEPLSKMSDYLAEGEIEESGILSDDVEMVSVILKNHRILIKDMRKIISMADHANDEGTIDMIGSLLEDLEKKSWMLDSWRVRKLEKAALNIH